MVNPTFNWNPGCETVVLAEEYIDGDEFDVDILMWEGKMVYAKAVDNVWGSHVCRNCFARRLSPPPPLLYRVCFPCIFLHLVFVALLPAVTINTSLLGPLKPRLHCSRVLFSGVTPVNTATWC